MSKYITHLTLDTGHSRRSVASEVSPGVRALVRQQIDEALAGLPVTIREPYGLTADAAGGALLATVISGGQDPICTIAVARNSRQGAGLWRLLKEIDASVTGDPPPRPWCAVRLYPALSDHLDVLHWLGDFERVVAWAWIEDAPRDP